jgi:hypothetical protein
MNSHAYQRSVSWKPEIIASAAGVLSCDYPELNRSDVVSVVLSVAETEPAEVGGLRLVYRARTRLHSVSRRQAAAFVSPAGVRYSES